MDLFTSVLEVELAVYVVDVEEDRVFPFAAPRVDVEQSQLPGSHLMFIFLVERTGIEPASLQSRPV